MQKVGVGKHRRAVPRRIRVLTALLRRYLSPHRKNIGLLALMQSIQTVTTLFLPALNAKILDQGVVRGDTGFVLSTGGVMVAVALVQIACAIAGVRVATRLAMSLGRDIRSAVFRKVQDFSAGEMGSFGVPSLITRTVNDVQQVQSLVLMGATILVPAPIMCIGGIALALQQDVPLSALMLLLIPVVLVAAISIVTQLEPLYRRQQAWIDRLNTVLREQITGVRVVRAFVRDAHERKRLGRTNSVLYAISLNVGRLMATSFPLISLVLNVFSVAVLWVGGYRIDSGAIEVGALTAFLSYMGLILLSIVMGMMVCITSPRAIVSAERIDDVLSAVPSVQPPSAPKRIAKPTGLVELENVEFRYPGAEAAVLRNINLTARPGETVAIVGSTGCGKTTLLNLITRSFDPTSGRVSIDGVDVRELDPKFLARFVGIVQQKAHLFSGNLSVNLRYGNPGATDEELWQALEIAQARDFIERMPGGLETPLAQGGPTFSGGQRQRLSIARTLAQKPQIYLFDDSFSALDYATDAKLRAALGPHTANATVIVVAQRISSIKRANRIVVLDSGEMVGSGTHEELMATCGTYQEIVQSQLTEQEQEAV